MREVVFASICGLAVTSMCACWGAPRYRGPVSDHFDGRIFRNQQKIDHVGFGGLLKWQLNRDHGPWLETVDAQPGPPPPKTVGPGALRVTFINHATVLIQMDGLNILTDPIWSERASPVTWAGPKRARPPGLRFEDLPRIDLVVVSHNHYDHMDLPTLKLLAQAHRPKILVGLGNKAILDKAKISGAVDIDWWQEVDIGGLKVQGVPAQHFSQRGAGDRDATLWLGYVFKGKGGPVYFAGDTGYGPHFEQIKSRFGRPRLAILPIGAYRPRWFMAPVHVSPEEAVRAAEAMDAQASLGMHFGTFPLADDGEDEPVLELRRALAGRSTRFWVLGFGEGRDVAPLP